MSGGINLAWKAPGPVSAAFMASTAPVQGIMGPIGSGKTGTCLMKLIRLAAAQAPGPDGWARTKWTVVRDNYRQLWRSVIPSWWRWVPQSTGEWIGGRGEPAVHTVRWLLGQRRIEMIVEFVAIGDVDVEAFMRGYEPTGFYLNEADKLPWDAFTFARGRAGRYPPMDAGGPSWYGLLLDFNAPPVTSDLYKALFEEPDASYKIFVQPGGRDPGAENLPNLPAGYYEEQIKGAEEWYVRRMVDNLFGADRSGKPVYPEFNDHLHVAREPLEPIAGLPIAIGVDAGLTPAAIFGQRLPNGAWRILRELVTAENESCGANRFGELLLLTLQAHYRAWLLSNHGPQIELWADPSAFFGGDKQSEDDLAWADTVARKLGLPIRPAPSNALTHRLEAVRAPLGRMIDGRPSFQLDPRCGRLRAGFNSTYRFRRRPTGDESYDDKPEKNAASHPHDALQYLILGGGEWHAARALDDARRAQSPRQTHADLGEDGGPYGSGSYGSGSYGGRRRHQDAEL